MAAASRFPPPKRILIIQLRRIGDVIVTTPVISALRKNFPESRIDFLTEAAPAEVLEGFPGLQETVVFRKDRFFRHIWAIRERRYDWVLDFMNNPRSAQIALLSGARIRAGFGVLGWGLVYNVRVPRPPVPKYAVQNKFDILRALGVEVPSHALPRLQLTDRDFSGVSGWWSRAGLDAYEEKIGLVPIHRHAIRQWPEEKFQSLVGLLNKRGRAFILFHGPGEEEDAKRIIPKGQDNVYPIPASTLRQTACLLSRCHAVVTNDSGAMHLSVAVGSPTVTIYGPTFPESWNPRVPPHRYLQAQGLRCLGCNLDRCPYRHECMEWVSPSRVAREVEEVLRK